MRNRIDPIRKGFGFTAFAVAGFWAFAAWAEPDAAGRPSTLQPGQVVRYYVWRDGGGEWHLRTTTKQQQHRFTGTIKIVGGGRIQNVNPAKLESQGDKKDWWSLNAQRDVITLDLSTKGQMDGFDFTVGPRVKELRFDLKVDGKDRPDRIFIGKKAENPAASSFTLPAK